jgi:hypothetical protein
VFTDGQSDFVIDGDVSEADRANLQGNIDSWGWDFRHVLVKVISGFDLFFLNGPLPHFIHFFSPINAESKHDQAWNTQDTHQNCQYDFENVLIVSRNLLKC